ncbi:hypothetical protein L0F63_005172 [Massospora cicadina]|nr:hypothetical protein L0F63_005172 [Massospora cicadina]
MKSILLAHLAATFTMAYDTENDNFGWFMPTTTVRVRPIAQATAPASKPPIYNQMSNAKELSP